MLLKPPWNATLNIVFLANLEILSVLSAIIYLFYITDSTPVAVSQGHYSLCFCLRVNNNNDNDNNRCLMTTENLFATCSVGSLKINRKRNVIDQQTNRRKLVLLHCLSPLLLPPPPYPNPLSPKAAAQCNQIKM